MAGRMLLAGFALLDRQIVDRDGRMAGKVDDLELAEPDGGGAPYVTGLVSGRGALARRIGGRLGRAAAWLSARLEASGEQPGPIPFGVVRELGNHIEITLTREDLDSFELERRLRDGVVAKIPGARHAPE
ncbi:MAG TPA: hypothetical protein VFV32_11205 [Acidimicrobiales bacterium]|jgi:hypothetical protein|nr:hypothetical protein [Acidimicrobiales bacterium]